MITFYILLGLTFIIFIHELGHFLVARWCGVKVYTFSIGFGPRVITFYRDRSGTEYILSLIPLGGYVRMKGQEDLPTKNAEEFKGENDHFLSKKPWQRLMIILAGVEMNLISAFFFVVIAFMIGIPFSSNVIGGFLPDSPAASSTLKIGDEIVEVNGVKTDTMEGIITAVALQEQRQSTTVKALRESVKGTQDIFAEINLSDGEGIPKLGIIPKIEFVISGLKEDSKLYHEGLRNGYTIEEVIPDLEGDRSELSLGYRGSLARFYIERNPGKNINLRYKDDLGQVRLLEGVQIMKKNVQDKGFYFSPKIQVIQGYPAQAAGLMDGDLVLSIDDKPIRHWDEILSYLQLQGRGDSLEVKVKRKEEILIYSVTPHYDNSRGNFILGVTAYINPENQGQEISYITPAMVKSVPGIREKDILINYTESEGQASVEVIREGNLVSFSYDQDQIGKKSIGYLFDYAVMGKTIRYSFFESFPASFSMVKQEFSEVLSFFYLLINGQMPLEVMGGPIAIFEVSYQVAENKGWSYFLLLLAKISISLVILNLLPIPVLDGGHACVILYEMIRRKPVPEKALRLFQAIGIVFLLVLIIYVNYNDINRILER